MSDPFEFGTPWGHRDPSTPLAAQRLNDREALIAEKFDEQDATLQTVETSVAAAAAKPLNVSSVKMIVFVHPSGNDSNDGLSWGGAKLTIEGARAALPAASTHLGGVIFLAPGSYSPVATVDLSGIALICIAWPGFQFGNHYAIIRKTFTGDLLTYKLGGGVHLEKVILDNQAGAVAGAAINATTPLPFANSTLTSGITLPQATIPVADTSNFSASGGTLIIDRTQTVTFTGRSTTSGAGNLTGCSGGSGAISNGASVTQQDPFLKISKVLIRDVRVQGSFERDLIIDGSGANDPGGPGVRTVHLDNVELFGCQTAGETAVLTQVVHLFAKGFEVIQAGGTGTQGIKIKRGTAPAGSATPVSVEDIYFTASHIGGDFYTEADGARQVFEGAIEGAITCAAGSAHNVFLGEVHAGTFTNSGAVSNRRELKAVAPFVITDSTGTTEKLQFTSSDRLQFIADSNAAIDRPTASMLRALQNFGVGNFLAVGPGSSGTTPTATVDVAQTSTSNVTVKLRTASWGSLQITCNGSSPGAVVIQTTNGTPLQFGTNGVNWLGITTGGDVIAGGGAKTTPAEAATNATAGFLYIPSVNGVPTGTPAAVTGGVPIVYDRANNQLYVYNGGAWKKTVALT